MFIEKLLKLGYLGRVILRASLSKMLIHVEPTALTENLRNNGRARNASATSAEKIIGVPKKSTAAATAAAARTSDTVAVEVKNMTAWDFRLITN